MQVTGYGGGSDSAGNAELIGHLLTFRNSAVLRAYIVCRSSQGQRLAFARASSNCEIDSTARFNSSHEKVGLYLSALSYSLGKQFLKNLSAVGMNTGEKIFLESLLPEALFLVKDALVTLVFVTFPF